MVTTQGNKIIGLTSIEEIDFPYISGDTETQRPLALQGNLKPI